MSANLKPVCFAKIHDDVSGFSPYNSVNNPAASEACEQNKQSREKKETSSVEVPRGVLRALAMQNGLTGELKRVKVKSGSDQACVEPLGSSSAKRMDQNPFPPRDFPRPNLRPLPRPFPRQFPSRDDDCSSKNCLLKRCCCIQ